MLFEVVHAPRVPCLPALDTVSECRLWAFVSRDTGHKLLLCCPRCSVLVALGITLYTARLQGCLCNSGPVRTAHDDCAWLGVRS
jgi:hypothetical protein